MSRKKAPKWKKFEALVADIQRSISPDAKISINERIVGNRTGQRREVDIAIRQTVGQFELLIVIDCKDYQKPVDVKDVEAFLGLVEDVGANKGAMVTASGYSKAAKVRALDRGVDLFRLVDAESQDWKSYVTIPIVCDFRSIEAWRVAFKADQKAIDWIAQFPAPLLPIFRSNRSFAGTVQSLLWEMWNHEKILHEPGEYQQFSPENPDLFIRLSDNDFFPVDILYDVIVGRKLFFGYLPITKIKGLNDEIKGGLILPNASTIETDWIDTAEVENSWKIIPSVDSLSVKPVVVLTASDHYPVDDPFKQ